MTFPKPDDDDQVLRALAQMHRQNAIAAKVSAWISPHVDIVTAVSNPENGENGAFNFAASIDAEFRRALARGDYPDVPPSITAAASAHERLRELEAAPGRVPLLGDVVMGTVEALLVGRPVDPAKFTDAVTEAHKHAEVAPAIRRVHNTVRQQVSDGWQGVVAGALPALLGGLRGALEELLAEARAACAALDGMPIDDPSAIAAARNAQRAALLALGPCSVRYERLRNAQQAALAAASGRLPGYHASEQRAAEPTTWAGVFNLGVHEFREVRLRGAIGSAVTGTARLAQVAGRPDVWLPDRAQLDQAYAEMFPRTTANDGGPDAA